MGNPYIPDMLRVAGEAGGWVDNPTAKATVLRLGRTQHVVMDQGLPPYGELALAGKLFSLSPGVVGNAVAPVQEQPTTASAYSLYNGNDEGSNIFLLPLKIAARAASGTLGLGASLIAGVASAKQSSAVANSTGVVGPGKHNPASSNGSNATLATGVTLAGAPAWVDLAGRDVPNAIEIGAAIVADVWGMFAIPPKYCLGTHIMAPAGTTAKFSIGVTYAEVKVIFP